MDATATSEQVTVPVVGMVWEHAKRKHWYDGSPVRLRVTSIRPRTVRRHSQNKTVVMVYSAAADGYNSERIKTPLDSFAKFCGKVVSVPDRPATPDKGPKLSDAQCRELHARAHQAGLDAGNAAIPAPMVVEEHLHPMDDTSPVIYRETVNEGICGFAWIIVRPGNGAYAKWMRRVLSTRRGFEGGEQLTVFGFGQSLTRKDAYADAYSKVLRDAGVRAYGMSRAD